MLHYSLRFLLYTDHIDKVSVSNSQLKEREGHAPDRNNYCKVYVYNILTSYSIILVIVKGFFFVEATHFTSSFLT